MAFPHNVTPFSSAVDIPSPQEEPSNDTSIPRWVGLVAGAVLALCWWIVFTVLVVQSIHGLHQFADAALKTIAEYFDSFRLV